MATTLHPPMEDPNDTGQVIYSSLLILGLDAASLEHNLRTPVNQKMFLRMNKKVGEALLHFLFAKIDPDKASKVFQDCWPIVDKKQESKFHKATFEWYKALQQGYGETIPPVVAKTFLAPGGPKFTSALMTLTLVALHSSVDKRVVEYTLLHFPTLSRNPSQNHDKLRLMWAAKRSHQMEFINKQRMRKKVLQRLHYKAKSLVENCRQLSSEDEKLKQELRVTLQEHPRMTQSQKEKFLSDPYDQIKEEILPDIIRMNKEAKELWDRVKKFYESGTSSWNVLLPLLEGTSSFSHLDGSMYSPAVPDLVYKEHAPAINKLGLQGLYTDGKLNLLHLIQYSTFALRSLLSSIQKTHSQARPESAEELRVQAKRASSMSESMDDLSSKINLLLPALVKSVSALRLRGPYETVSFDSLDLEGKLQLCPPTPPLSLVGTPVGTPVSNFKAGKWHPLQLTPGTFIDKRRTVHCAGSNATPTRLLSSLNISRAARKSPKADVVFSPSTHLDDSIVIDTREESSKVEMETGLTIEMVTVDCRGSYQHHHEQRMRDLYIDTNRQPQGKTGLRSTAPRPSRIPKQSSAPSKTSAFASRPQNEKSGNVMSSSKEENTLPEVTEQKETKIPVSEDKQAEDALMDRLADMLVSNEESDDSGALELTSTSTSSRNATVIEISGGDSGCAEGTIDSETLLEAIEKIDITPKSKRKKGRDSLSLRKTMSSSMRHDKQTPFKEVDPHCARLIDFTPFNPPSRQIFPEVLLAEDPFKTPALTKEAPVNFKGLITNGRECNPCKTPVPLKTPIGSNDPGLFEMDMDKTPVPVVIKEAPVAMRGIALNETEVVSSSQLERPTSSEDLLARMSFLTESPARDQPTPFAKKIFSRFEGIDFKKPANPPKLSERDGYNATVKQPRRKPKVDLEDLKEEMQYVKQTYSNGGENAKDRRKTEFGLSSKFLSFVDNVKNTKDWSENGEDAESAGSRACFGNAGNPAGGIAPPSKPRIPERESFHSSVARLEELLGNDDDDDDTFTGKDIISAATEETFMSSEDFEKTVLRSPNRRSSYLPRDSIFDTLTESILAGEVSSSLLAEEDVRDEVRRESISSRRQSLMSLGKMSIGSSKGLSDALTVFQSRMSIDTIGIFDEDDSCLLSTSVEELEF